MELRNWLTFKINVMKNKKYAFYNGSKNCIQVNTPEPYFIDCKDRVDLDTSEKMKETIDRLENSAKFLNDCLKLLGISKETAIKMRYTLNWDTGDKLKSLAWRNENISREIRKLILEYDW